MGQAITTLGAGIHGGITFDHQHHLFSLRTTSTDPAFGGETWDIAFLYGRGTRIRSFYVSAGLGASVIGGTRYPRLFGGGRGEQMQTMIGFPLEGQISWQPLRYLAVDLYSFANVNTEQPFGGVGLSLRAGKLW
ncbi:hypothetical protein ACG2F4_07910 [Halalkalibaculum sp. DA3122]|uniref:hypothetical protein n=1 Tax=Halalkalibaculum sp. DA3122 TaxID=3373607 RepID=UPI0037552419